MKFLKWFSLFFVSMGIALIAGIAIGSQLIKYFYPQKENIQYSQILPREYETKVVIPPKEDDTLQMVSVSEERINADTQYVCIERDMMTGEEVPVCTKLPQKYAGLNREQFIESMKEYEQSPPLGERERGLVSVEVLRFSSEEVEVQMNYKYVRPTESFYIVVYDDKLRVLLDDRKTVYLETGILAYDLPLDLQKEIMQGMYVPDEEELYAFLENYTS